MRTVLLEGCSQAGEKVQEPLFFLLPLLLARKKGAGLCSEAGLREFWGEPAPMGSSSPSSGVAWRRWLPLKYQCCVVTRATCFPSHIELPSLVAAGSSLSLPLL